MPPYNPSPGSPPLLLQPSVNGYAYGSFSSNSPTVLMQVTGVSISSNVATVNVTMREGYIPAIGSLVTISGTSSNGGVFNVSGVALTGVSINSTTGIGTITFGLINANISQTPDSGKALVAVPEVPEPLTNSTSQAFAIPENSPAQNENGITVTWSTAYPSAPSAVSMQLQASITNVDSQFQTLDTSTNTSGDLRVITLTRFRFIRMKATGVSGGSSPTVIGKICI